MKSLLMLLFVACNTREAYYERYCARLIECWPGFLQAGPDYQKQCVIQTKLADAGTERELNDIRRVPHADCDEIADILATYGLSKSTLNLLK